MSIFKVLSSLNHNGTIHEKGSILNVEVNAGQFDSLVADGVLELVDGARTEDEAKEIIASKVAENDTVVAPEAVKPQDTWGPQPDKEAVLPPVATETAPVEATAPEATIPSTDAQIAPEKVAGAETEAPKAPEVTGNDL